MKPSCWLLPLLLAGAGCHSGNLTPLQRRLLAQCADKPAACEVRLAAATDFAWTECYILGQGQTNPALSQQLPYLGSDVFCQNIVFLNGPTVVYHEEIVVPIEHFEEGELSLLEAEGVYTPENGVFYLRPGGGQAEGDEHYFRLVQRPEPMAGPGAF